MCQDVHTAWQTLIWDFDCNLGPWPLAPYAAVHQSRTSCSCSCALRWTLFQPVTPDHAMCCLGYPAPHVGPWGAPRPTMHCTDFTMCIRYYGTHLDAHAILLSYRSEPATSLHDQEKRMSPTGPLSHRSRHYPPLRQRPAQSALYSVYPARLNRCVVTCSLPCNTGDLPACLTSPG